MPQGRRSCLSSKPCCDARLSRPISIRWCRTSSHGGGHDPVSDNPALLLSSAPALAQACKITRNDGGLETFASAAIDGSTAKSVLYGAGRPAFFDLKLDPDARAKGYSFKDNGKLGLYIYRTGKSQDGKDWMQPGSVATEVAGFDIDWPCFVLKKNPVKSVGVDMKMEGMRGMDVLSKFKDGLTRDGFSRPLDFAFNSPRRFVWFSAGAGEDDEYDIEQEWLARINPETPITIEFYDASGGSFFNNKIAKQKIATAMFSFPANDVFQARYVADFTALRKAFTEKRCETAK